MKTFMKFLLLATMLVFTACQIEEPTQPTITTIQPQTLPLSKMVFVGNSLTAGYQSGGLVEDFQRHSYPYFIAQQMGRASTIQMPWLAAPGFGSANTQTGEAFGPLKYENGQILPGDPVPGGIAGISNLLVQGGNATLSRPYDNLGVPGAKLHDVLTAYDATTASSVNPFFNLVLRNPNFGNTTQVQQAQLLAPTLVALWVGNNDVLGAALAGGNLSLITPVADFQADYIRLIQEIAKIRDGNVGIVLANIPNVTDIPYVNLLDNLIYRDVPVPGVGLVKLPVVFGPTFQPVDFDPDPTSVLYLPLLTAEGIMGGQASPVKHVLLPFLSQYQATGLGVPDSTAIANLLIGAGYPAPIAAGLAQQAVQGMIAAGLTPSGVPIPGSLTITADEEAGLLAAVTAFNQVIAGIAGAKIPVVDMNAALNQLNTSGLDGYSGKFVFFDPANTAFSLDGVHPNNGGNAIMANLFIDKINQVLGLAIPKVNTAAYKGQYLGKNITGISPEAALQARAIFTDF